MGRCALADSAPHHNPLPGQGRGDRSRTSIERYNRRVCHVQSVVPNPPISIPIHRPGQAARATKNESHSTSRNPGKLPASTSQPSHPRQAMRDGPVIAFALRDDKAGSRQKTPLSYPRIPGDIFLNWAGMLDVGPRASNVKPGDKLRSEPYMNCGNLPPACGNGGEQC